MGHTQKSFEYFLPTSEKLAEMKEPANCNIKGKDVNLFFWECHSENDPD